MNGTQKPPGGHAAHYVTTLLSRALVEALDRYISEEAPGKNRSEALREAFKDGALIGVILIPTKLTPT